MRRLSALNYLLIRQYSSSFTDFVGGQLVGDAPAQDLRYSLDDQIGVCDGLPEIRGQRQSMQSGGRFSVGGSFDFLRLGVDQLVEPSTCAVERFGRRCRTR